MLLHFFLTEPAFNIDNLKLGCLIRLMAIATFKVLCGSQVLCYMFKFQCFSGGRLFDIADSNSDPDSAATSVSQISPLRRLRLSSH